MKKQEIFQMLVIAILSSVLVASCSKYTAKFQGKVVEKITGKPVSGAKIDAYTETNIAEEKPHTHLQGITDAQGIYILKGAIPSIEEKFKIRGYRIHASKEGYSHSYADAESPPENKTALVEDISILQLPPEESGYIRLFEEDKFVKLPLVPRIINRLGESRFEWQPTVVMLDTTGEIIPKVVLNGTMRFILYIPTRAVKKPSYGLKWEYPIARLEHGSKAQSIPPNKDRPTITMLFNGYYQRYISSDYWGINFTQSPNLFDLIPILEEASYKVLQYNGKLAPGVYCYMGNTNYIFEIVSHQ
jgi:hypothetical protein